MSKFMGHCIKGKATRNHRNSATFTNIPGHSSDITAIFDNCVFTIVNDSEVNICVVIKLEYRINLETVKYRSHRVVVKIVLIGMSPIDAMHQRLALGIGFKTEGSVAVAMRLHLLGIKGLNPANNCFHRIDHCGAIRTVVGQNVEHPHRARFAHVQVRQLLGRRAGMIAPPLLIIE